MADAAPLGVYVHWPYCARICPYCDFNVVRDRGRSAEGHALVDAIRRDLQGHARLMANGPEPSPSRLVSLYFGGGTPSLMRPEHVASLVAEARALWPAGDAVEVTLEANPLDADAGRFAAFASAGVNRLSLGVQSFDDAELAFLGRDHDAVQAHRALDLALDVFPRVSFDLIYALPGQTPEAWRLALDQAAGFGADHISAYQLTLESGTALERAARRGVFATPDEALAATFQTLTTDVLAARGYHAYEVSNFARGPAARSRHNLVYWRGESYVGAGPGAHGRVQIAGVRLATEAERRPQDYIARVAADGVGWTQTQALKPFEVLEERILMGLRIEDGVERADIERLGRLSALQPLLDDGWLAAEGGRVRATAAGRLLLDSVTGALLA